MSFWDEAGEADGNSRGNYFQGDGEYNVEILGVKHKAGGFKGESVIVNVQVLTSDNPEVQPGSVRSCAWNITKHKQMAHNNIKSFVCGVFGMNDSAKDAETKSRVVHVSKRMVDADNPLQGVRVHLTTFNTKTQAGKDFTVLVWAPYTEDGYVPPYPGAAPAGFAPPPPPPPPAAGRKPWEGLPDNWQNATHYYNGSAWVAKSP